MDSDEDTPLVFKRNPSSQNKQSGFKTPSSSTARPIAKSQPLKTAPKKPSPPVSNNVPKSSIISVSDKGPSKTAAPSPSKRKATSPPPSRTAVSPPPSRKATPPPSRTPTPPPPSRTPTPPPSASKSTILPSRATPPSPITKPTPPSSRTSTPPPPNRTPTSPSTSRRATPPPPGSSTGKSSEALPRPATSSAVNRTDSTHASAKTEASFSPPSRKSPVPEPSAKTNVQESSSHNESSDSDDDVPIGARLPVTEAEESEDDIPIGARAQTANNSAKKRPADAKEAEQGGRFKRAKSEEESESEEDVPLARRATAVTAKIKATTISSSNGKVKKKVTVTRQSEKRTVKKTVKNKNGKTDNKVPGGGGDVKWTTLEHHGVIFPPEYKPHGVKMLYKGKPVELTAEQEEVATMFAVMRETDYANKSVFIKNFWSDWKEVLGSRHTIQKMDDCDFTPIWEWHLAEKEKKKQITAEEKKRLKEEKLAQEDKYMWAIVDGVKEKVGNFRVEPPGLFRGRGEHPKMGKLKRRIFPENIVINIGSNAPIPVCPLPGHRWKEVRHDNTVTWLAFWNDPINQRECKYVFLAASSSLKGQSDKEKYEKARKLKDYIESIRETYTRHFDSKDPTKRQIAVATYLIDRLALRAGNEKDDDEADTVGCCSLKVEHVRLIPPASLQFDFLGKDSIRYFNTVEVEPKVFKAVGEFQKGKKNDDDIFDKLDTSKLNTHLKELMPSLTAKVFRTFNASITLDKLLQETGGQTVQEKIADYQRANKEVAILCNHQRSVSKAHAGQMEKLEGKMDDLQTMLSELEEDLDRAQRGKGPLKRDSDGTPRKAQSVDVLEKKVAQTKAKIEKMKLDMEVKEDLKTVALGTSKINYMDPRISIAWCKRHDVPIEKIFNKSLLAKFVWAMDVEPDFRF